MNTPSPLLPQGALPPKAKSSLYFKILMVLGIHVVVIGGLLMQGCNAKDSAKDATPTTTVADQSAPNNNPAPAPAPVSAPAPVDTSTASAAAQAANTAPLNTAPAPIPTPTAQTPSTLSATPVAPPIPASPAAPVASMAIGGEHDYVIVQGDTLAAIAHKNGVSLRALQEANAGINPRKLKIGQKLQIPTGGATAPASSAASIAGAGAADAGATEATVYTVKPGDMLLKIAKAHGTRVKTIMEMNDLKTTSIRVGQKLKLPSKMTAVELPASVTPSTQTASTPSAGAPAPTASAN